MKVRITFFCSRLDPWHRDFVLLVLASTGNSNIRGESTEVEETVKASPFDHFIKGKGRVVETQPTATATPPPQELR